MAKPYYVTLTGSRNNAGDYLIRHRGHGLLNHLRPDREIVNLNAWEPFDADALATVNGAAALLLLGGPALRKDMHPTVYPLIDDLSAITAPITIMGAGWHAAPGTWEESRGYRFTPPTLALLRRIEADGLGLSVRDYRSLNTLSVAGISGGVMTGCPALYDPIKLGQPYAGWPQNGVQNLVISLGVTFIRSLRLEQQTKQLITDLRRTFPGTNLTVAFHHSIAEADLKAAYGNTLSAFAERHLALVDWLQQEDIAYQDISGGVDKLIELYDNADFHVGYRVHAHIFMSSQRKPSVLLTEDGRGRGLKEVLGGLIYDSWMPRRYSIKERLLAKVGQLKKDNFVAFTGIGDDIAAAVSYEAKYGAPRLGQPSQRIDLHWGVMEGYLGKLP